MKKTLKLAGLLLALVMVLSMLPIAAMAEDPACSITINNPVAGQIYSAYKMLDVNTYVADESTGVATSATYKVADGWAGFFTGDMLNYFEINETTGEVTKKVTGTNTDWTAAEAEAIAKAALAYAETLEADGSITTATEGNTVITGLTPGYYVVDSTLGTLCALNTAAENATINEKNDVPTVEKVVAAIDKDFGETDTDTVSIGDVVTYTATIAAKKGADTYVFHDEMDEGLTFDSTSVVVNDGTDDLTAGEDYTLVTTGLDDDCTFEVVFAQAYLDTIAADTTITITYDATVNESAIADDDDDLDNTAKLTYGDSNTTEEKTATVNTYGFELVKTDASNNVITGAEFKLYADEDCTEEIKVVAITGGYRVATADEASSAVVIAAGDVFVDGLGAGTYYLKETKQPDGYTMLDEPKEVVIEDADLTATVTSNVWSAGGVQVINQAGQVLPTTGGMGTTLIYVAGAILVIGAGVLLVAKKRMAAK